MPIYEEYTHWGCFICHTPGRPGETCKKCGAQVYETIAPVILKEDDPVRKLLKDWHKSSHSADNGCFEVRIWEDSVDVRNSKKPGPIVTFAHPEWRAFVGGARDGEFDL